MIAYLDCSSGISGDKFLGALLDAGFSTEELRAALARLGISPDEVIVERVTSGGIAAVSVKLSDRAASSAQPLRHLADIRDLLAEAELSERVATRALAVFTALAEAEAAVHGTNVHEAHFHEIGALDTILDAVGVVLGLEALGVERLIATTVALGAGTVDTEHGLLPVPAPATAHILFGVPVVGGPSLASGEPAGELTTPTGAALLRALAAEFGPMPSMVPAATGYGAGTRDLGFANVARIVLGTPVDAPPAADPAGGEATGLATESVAVLATNIDHATPEHLAFAAEELLRDGALDVWQTPIVMKKSRAAFEFSIMCWPEKAEWFASRIHALTGTLGVRRTVVERTIVGRDISTVATRHGTVRVKVARQNGRVDARPEFEDVARIARETKTSFVRVAEELSADIAEALSLE